MEIVLQAKFHQHQYLQASLVDTGDCELIEDSPVSAVHGLAKLLVTSYPYLPGRLMHSGVVVPTEPGKTSWAMLLCASELPFRDLGDRTRESAEVGVMTTTECALVIVYARRRALILWSAIWIVFHDMVMLFSNA